MPEQLEIYAESEPAYKNRINLDYVAGNLPRLIEKIIVGMPMRFSGDEKQLLEIANDCIQYEIERREKLGRNPDENPTKNALKMRRSRANRKPLTKP